jgi:hypothetical protein
MSFWDFVWFIVITYCFLAYLMLLFHICGDLYRDSGVGGFAKAMWTLFLIILPFLGIVVYLIARGDGMAQRTVQQFSEAQDAQEAYIRQVAVGATPAEQVAQAKTLLDSGTISTDEFEAMKTRALA